jgi:ribonucleoside-diphosphate reductase alpha chain
VEEGAQGSRDLPRRLEVRSTTQRFKGNKSSDTAEQAQAAVPSTQNLMAPPKSQRHRLPDERSALTHKFSFGGHEGYITVGLYPNGQPGEMFIRMAKEGSTISGLMDSFAMIFSVALQYGVPLQSVCEKLAHTRFEPSGWTGNEKMGYAKSIMDYLGRWMQHRFLEGEQLDLFALPAPAPSSVTQSVVSTEAAVSIPRFGDSPTCGVCGSLMQQSGSCFRSSCGSTSGCS